MNETDSQDREQWQGVTSFEDVGELTAQWIEGKISYYPLYGGPIDHETTPLANLLAEFNRKGYVTTFSQPAERLSQDGSGQRACVDGFVKEELAKRLAALTLHTDLLVIALPPSFDGGYAIPITVDDFHPFTWSGHGGALDEIQFIMEEGLMSVASCLMSAWKVCIVDPKWGREEYLWKKVWRVLNDRQGPLRRYNATCDETLGHHYNFYTG